MHKEKSVNNERELRNSHRSAIRQTFEQIRALPIQPAISVPISLNDIESPEFYFQTNLTMTRVRHSLEAEIGLRFQKEPSNWIAKENYNFYYFDYQNRPIHVNNYTRTKENFKGRGFGSGLLLLTDSLIEQMVEIYPDYLNGKQIISFVDDLRFARLPGYGFDTYWAKKMGYKYDKKEDKFLRVIEGKLRKN